MCGILGYFGNNKEEFRSKINLNKISHRGPDSSGSIHGNPYYLGHTRLSMLDLSSNGNQPMISKDGKHALIFNGEIYNHKDLSEKYLKNVPFNYTSDTETLLYGLIHHGDMFIKKLK